MCIGFIYFIKANITTTFFKVALLRVWLFEAHSHMISANEGKNEYAASWGKFLQSIVFDEIHLPGP